MFWRVLSAAVLAAVAGFAQGEMGSGGMSRGGGMDRERGAENGGMAGMRVERQSPFDQFAEKLKLSKDEKTEAQTILQDAAKEISPVQQKEQQIRQNLAGAFINGQSGNPVDQLLKAYASLGAQTATIEATAFGKICKMLKPNQKKNAPQAFELLAQIFERPRTGGGRGGERSQR